MLCILTDEDLAKHRLQRFSACWRTAGCKLTVTFGVADEKLKNLLGIILK